MAVLIWLVMYIAVCYSMENARFRLYAQLDDIDNELRRLCAVQSQLIANKTRILRQLTELNNLPKLIPMEPPTAQPTVSPTLRPSQSPTAQPTFNPTYSPTAIPSKSPTQQPTTLKPTHSPTKSPTLSPTIDTSPIKKNIEKLKFNKSVRRKGRSESAKKLDEDLLEAAMHTKKMKKIVKLYTYEGLDSEEEIKLIDTFEKDLMKNHKLNDLIIIDSFLGAQVDDHVNNMKFIGHATDIFLMEFIERFIGRIYTRTLSAKLLADYIANSLQRLACADLTPIILPRVLDKVIALPDTVQVMKFAEFIMAVNVSKHDINFTSSAFSNFEIVPAYDVMLSFLHFLFEEVVDYTLKAASCDLENSQYGKSGKVPEKYQECLKVVQEQGYVQTNIAHFFGVAQSENTSEVYRASKHLKDSLQVLHLMTSNFQIGKTIYDWQQNQEDGGVDAVIAISATANTESRQINDFLVNLGYSESQIERYKVMQDPKSKKINLITSVIKQVGNDAVKVTKYAKDDVYLYEKMLFEANDGRNDLVFVMDLDVLDEAKIKGGRYSLTSEFDLRSRSIVKGFENFLSRILWPFGESHKRVINVLLSCVIFPLTVLHECLFESILAEYEELSANKNSTEWSQMCRIIQIGYRIMRKQNRYEELKMVKFNGKNDNGFLEAVFGFVEVVIKQIYLVYIESNEFNNVTVNGQFMKIQKSGIKEMFASINNLRRDADNDVLKFGKYMKRFTKRCLEGEGAEGCSTRRGQNTLPEIFAKIEEFRMKKGILRMGNELYEWREQKDETVIFIGFDHLCFPYFDNEQKITLFLNAIGYKSIAMNDESKMSTVVSKKKSLTV